MNWRVVMCAGLALALAAVAAAPVEGAAARRHRRSPAKDPLVGTWELESGQLGPGLREIKVIAGGHFTWTTWDTTTHAVVATAGGRYLRRPGRYDECIEFADKGNEIGGLVGRWLHFGVFLNGDKLVQVGTPDSLLGGLHEVWRRAR